MEQLQLSFEAVLRQPQMTIEVGDVVSIIDKQTLKHEHYKVTSKGDGGIHVILIWCFSSPENKTIAIDRLKIRGRSRAYENDNVIVVKVNPDRFWVQKVLCN